MQKQKNISGTASTVPLAERMRPQSADTYLGQEKISVARSTVSANTLRRQGIRMTLNHFPLESSPAIRRNYVSALRDSVILRDIIARHQIREPYLLDRLVAFSIDSVGSLFSVNSIVKYLNANGLRSNSETVGSYIGYLRDAFFLHESERYDIKGRRILAGERKYYLNDTAFRTYLSSQFEAPVSRHLENIVYLTLRRRGYTVYTGVIGGREIDFIAERGRERLYVQAAWLLSDESVVAREFGNLEAIHDNHEKVVVTADDLSFGNRDGINHVRAWDFVE